MNPNQLLEIQRAMAEAQKQISNLQKQLLPPGSKNGLPLKNPNDTVIYSRDPRSSLLSSNTLPGIYVYVRDADGLIYVCPDEKAGHGTHLHPKILGLGQAVAGAGSIKIGVNGFIERIDNYSGTFQFGPEILEDVLKQTVSQGLKKSNNTQFVPWTKHF